jgi:ribonucleoside-diphosphate reductase beta chain
MDYSVLNLNINSDCLFFGESGHGIARYDVVRYPALMKLNKHMRTLFWEPELTDMSGEKRSFSSMTDAEQFVFTSNLKRQILLDSVQGRSPALVFAPHCTDPILENCLSTWSFFETIHSESYTHILKAIYPDPSKVVDSIPEIKSIADCGTAIAAAYDLMVSDPSKENLYLALVAANSLEALRFYVSFACTFNFGERKLVEGSANIVRQIARDETQHMALTQHIIKALPKDDPEFIQIIGDNRARALEIYGQARDQEKEWGSYLVSYGPFLGLNEGIFNSYIDHLYSKQVNALGLASVPKIPNPVPWISKWLSSESVQKAPQETEVPFYLAATALSNDLDSFVPEF